MKFRAWISCFAVAALLLATPLTASADELRAPVRQGRAVPSDLLENTGLSPFVSAGLSSSFGTPVGGIPLDAYEPDDTLETARAVTFGTTESRSIDATTGHGTSGLLPDYDVYVFTATPDTLYTFETSGTADTVLEVYNDYYYETYAVNDDIDPAGGNFGSKITWTAPDDPDTSTYYVFVAPANDETGVGDYTFTANQQASTVIPSAVQRLQGADRYAVAENVAHKGFPGFTYLDTSTYTRKPCNTVIVANGTDAKMADPLAAASLAGIYHAPIMLVTSTGIPSATTRVINAIKAGNGGAVDIIVVGGTGTVPGSLFTALGNLKGTGTITRIAGADRYDLAGKIADKVSTYWVTTYGHQPRRVFVCNGENPASFYDALAVGPSMYRMRAPLLLTRNGSVPTATSSRIKGRYADSSTTQLTVLNKAYLPSTLWGQLGVSKLWVWSDTKDRTWASYDIAARSVGTWAMTSDRFAVANKLSDAISGGAAMGELGAPMVYTGSTAQLSNAAWFYAYLRRSAIDEAYVLGGPASVSSYAFTELVVTLQ